MRLRSCLRLAVALGLLLGGCKVGPNYKQPNVPAPPAFKEPPPQSFKEWQQAHPNDGALRGTWWEMYNDPQLNQLEAQVNISNQNVLAAEALFQQARAAVSVAHAQLYPTVTVSPGISASQGSRSLSAGQLSSTLSAAGRTRTDFLVPFTVSYTPDVWGSIRRNITANKANAQATDAQLENARLLYHALLAENYFSLRGADAQVALLTTTVSSFEDYLRLTKARMDAGVASASDVALAETQLDTARAQLIDVGLQRAQFEHAVAVLAGKAPSELTLAPEPLKGEPPPIPPVVPAELLERRPDIAASERQAAAANEEIGIATAAYYPTFSFTGSVGLESSSITRWLSWPSHFWSVGPQAAELLFDGGGRRRGLVQEAQAAYDATVAQYRQTVLSAFQEVEDELAALRILEQEAAAQGQAVAAAQDSLRLTTTQYQAGTSSYLQVLTSQTALLNNQVNQISVQTRRMSASVLLIQSLGGGWDVSQIPVVR